MTPPPPAPHEIEILRRSIAMLNPGESALSRERALELLAWLQRTERELFELRTGVRPAVPIEEVEPVSEIVRRFQTGAMSYGSI